MKRKTVVLVFSCPEQQMKQCCKSFFFSFLYCCFSSSFFHAVGPVLFMSKWQMTTSQAVSIRLNRVACGRIKGLFCTVTSTGKCIKQKAVFLFELSPFSSYFRCFLPESSNASLLTNAEKIATITTTHTPQQSTELRQVMMQYSFYNTHKFLEYIFF